MANTVLTYLDMYCERAGGVGPFAEPLNLFTNLFFMFAAITVARLLLHTPAQGKRTDLWFLTALMFTIGIGSGLWHMLPSRATMLMDVIPITLFINVFILSSLRRLFVLSWAKVALWWGVYTAASVIAQITLPPTLLNGTIMYIPTYVTLVLLTLLLRQRNPAAGRAFTAVVVVWTASLACRTLDMQLCASLFIGLHFLWHTLNAWVLWRLLVVLVKERA